MENQRTRDNYSGKFPDSVPFFDFAGLLEISRNTLKVSTTLQALGKEWTEFVGARLHEESQLLQTLRECKELPSMQRAYMQFWEKALSQYGEETQRLVRITQGAMQEAAHSTQERIDATSGGNAHGSAVSSSSMPPSPAKKGSASHRERA
jgi:hypothetical protein